MRVPSSCRRRAELALDFAQLAGQAPGGLAQAVLGVVGELRADLVAPLLARAGDDPADGVALAAAAGLERVDLAPPDAREIAAGEAGERPADRVRGLAEVNEMLLGLVGVEPDRVAERFRPRRRILFRRFRSVGSVWRERDDQALQGVEPAPGVPPFVLVVPGEGGAQRLGRPPAVGEAEAGEHAARPGLAESVDQELAQQPERDGVEQQRALAGEVEDAATRFEAEQFPEVEVARPHGEAPFTLRVESINMSLLGARARTPNR